MSYIVWVHVENDDEADSDPQKAWWSVNQFNTLKEAIEEAEDICSQHYARTGVEPQRLDGDECDDCGRTDGTHNYEVEH